MYVFFFAANWSRSKLGILQIIVIVVYHHSLEAVANYDLNFRSRNSRTFNGWSIRTKQLSMISLFL